MSEVGGSVITSRSSGLPSKPVVRPFSIAESVGPPPTKILDLNVRTNGAGLFADLAGAEVQSWNFSVDDGLVMLQDLQYSTNASIAAQSIDAPLTILSQTDLNVSYCSSDTSLPVCSVGVTKQTISTSAEDLCIFGSTTSGL